MAPDFPPDQAYVRIVRPSGFVHPLSDPRRGSAAIAGAKAANIAQAATAGFRTVPGFVVTTAAVAAGLDEQHVLAEVRRGLRRPDRRFGRAVGSPFVLHDRGRWSVVDGRSVHLGARRRRMGCVPECGAPGHRLGHSGPRRHRRCPTHRRTRPAPTLRRDRRSAVRRRSRHRRPRPRRRRSSRRSPRRARRRHGTCRPLRALTPRSDRAEDPAGCGVRRSTERSAVHWREWRERSERVFGAPQDIEWCVDTTGRLWMLQSRPVTAMASGDSRSVRRARTRADRRDVPGQVATASRRTCGSGPFATASRGRCAPPARRRRRRSPARP